MHTDDCSPAIICGFYLISSTLTTQARRRDENTFLFLRYNLPRGSGLSST
jgi:hypothetical protein